MLSWYVAKYTIFIFYLLYSDVSTHYVLLENWEIINDFRLFFINLNAINWCTSVIAVFHSLVKQVKKKDTERKRGIRQHLVCKSGK